MCCKHDSQSVTGGKEGAFRERWNSDCNAGKMTLWFDNGMRSDSFLSNLLRLVGVLFCSQMKVFSGNHPLLLAIFFKIAFIPRGSFRKSHWTCLLENQA